jgi:hypothetical protein
MQRLLLSWTAEIGMQREDYAGAHELAVRASSMADAGVADWVLRVNAAFFAHDRLDACRSLTYLYRQWPDTRSGLQDEVVFAIAGRTPGSEAEKECRSPLLEALYEARWTDAYTSGASWFVISRSAESSIERSRW